jgi:hypothetical protein
MQTFVRKKNDKFNEARASLNSRSSVEEVRENDEFLEIVGDSD